MLRSVHRMSDTIFYTAIAEVHTNGHLILNIFDHSEHFTSVSELIIT